MFMIQTKLIRNKLNSLFLVILVIFPLFVAILLPIRSLAASNGGTVVFNLTIQLSNLSKSMIGQPVGPINIILNNQSNGDSSTVTLPSYTINSSNFSNSTTSGRRYLRVTPAIPIVLTTTLYHMTSGIWQLSTSDLSSFNVVNDINGTTNGKKYNNPHEFYLSKGSSNTVTNDTVNINGTLAASKVPQTTATGNATGTGTPQLSCNAGYNPLNWILCAIVKGLVSAMSGINSLIDSLLNLGTCQNSGSTSPNAIFGTCNGSNTNQQDYYAAWSSFRDIALGLLVLIGLIVIIAQAIKG